MKVPNPIVKIHPWQTLIQIIIVTSVAVSVLPFASAIKRVSYGESCDQTTFCRSKEFISCQEGTCACVKPDAMIYNSENRSCVTLVGERCSYTVVSGQENSDSDEEQKSTSVSYRQDLGCVQNAKCNSLGYCACENNFFTVSNGTCEPKRHFGEICSVDNECREDLLLTCNESNGKCECKSETAYELGLGKCVGQAEKACVEKLCVQNAECDQEEYTGPRYYNYNYGMYQYPPSNPNYLRCKCKSGFTKLSDGRCYKPHGESCDSSPSYCSPDLVCRAKVCSCPFPKHQAYDDNLKKCISKIGGPCYPNFEDLSVLTLPSSNLTTCISHASCIAEDNDAFKCTCDSGYVENAKRECDLAYGAKCPQDGLECDKEAGLVCIENSYCKCPDELQTYDLNHLTCKGLVGSTCSIQEIGFCVEGSHCVSLRVSESGIGICKCDEGYNFIPENKTCEKPQIPQKPKAVNIAFNAAKAASTNSAEYIEDEYQADNPEVKVPTTTPMPSFRHFGRRHKRTC